ncbi:MAG: hypothetical protein HYS98_07670 [Deltaproteobacteria bacterium]|nr:hypothetical protein [Deltaproteobacteria bacterium]
MSSSLVLIDSSSWIEALRKNGKREIKDRVERLLVEGQATSCEMVLLELWNGARGKEEKNYISELEMGN